jgi:hypothetical protein
MAHFVGRLTALKVTKVKKPSMYADGAGLYLQVTGDGETNVAKSSIYRFTLRGRSREMGLGSVLIFGLAEARAKATECRKLTYEGVDPIEARRAAIAKAALNAALSLTFKECTAQYIDAHRAGWRNAKHAAQWNSTLKTYAEPVIGPLPIQNVDTVLVMKIIESLWPTKPETASGLRGRIEAVLDPGEWPQAGIAREYRADFLTFLALDLYLSIPTDPHQFGQAPSVILIALVHAHRQSRVRMPSVDADHRKIDSTQFML